MTAVPVYYWPATQRPIDVNHGGPMLEQRGLVVHVQEGLSSPWGWFNDPAAEVSSHLWIGRDGTVEQYVPLDEIAWAEVLGNPYYLSVETEGFTPEPLSYAQQGSLAALIAWGHTELGWPLRLVDHGGNGITTHAHYPSEVPDPAWGGHACPGHLRSLQLPKILQAADAIARPI